MLYWLLPDRELASSCDVLVTALDCTGKLVTLFACDTSELTRVGDLLSAVDSLVSGLLSSGAMLSLSESFETDFVPVGGHAPFSDSLVSVLVGNSALAIFWDSFPFWNGPKQKPFCDMSCECFETEVALKRKVRKESFSDLLVSELVKLLCGFPFVCFFTLLIVCTTASNFMFSVSVCVAAQDPETLIWK